MTHHQRIRRLEHILADTWARNGRHTYENSGSIMGLICTSYWSGEVEEEYISLTELAEEIDRELEPAT